MPEAKCQSAPGDVDSDAAECNKDPLTTFTVEHQKAA